MHRTSFHILAIALILVVFSLYSFVAKGQNSGITEAHQRSAFAIIDPLYKIAEIAEGGKREYYWLYGRSELECQRLQVLMDRVKKAKLNVNYPGKYHTPFTEVMFRLSSNSENAFNKLDFKAVGNIKVIIDGKQFYQAKASENTHQLNLPQAWKSVVFELVTDKEPPALLLSQKQLPYLYGQWQWRADDLAWQPANCFFDDGTFIPPHRLELNEKPLQAVKKEGLFYDFGREIFGHVAIKSKIRPFITVGESIAEAMDTTSASFEQDVTMVMGENGEWVSANPLAFRYLKIHRGEPDHVVAQIVETPVNYHGAFACSDSTLTRIWMNSAYTLRLCMQDFLLDGVKRDRLPWTGDMVMSMLANAYTFADKEIVRRSLVALGREGIKEADINGIIDYSLWWIIAQEYYQLYYGDSLHLQQEWSKVKETYRLLQARTDNNGFLPTDDSWLFIDWVDSEKATSLQILWWWALQSAFKLAERVGDKEFVSTWRDTSEKLKANLYQLAWNHEGHHWRGAPTPLSKPTKHAALLAVISGLADKGQYEFIRNTLVSKDVDPVGTPYMAGFELMALNRAGGSDAFSPQLKSVWGEMLKLGATTFWEAYDSNNRENEHYAFYGRPYAKSLCHAWGAGPAALLPSEILNLRPVDTGWSKFTINPAPANLEWIVATVPTPFGNIEVEIQDETMQLHIPAGATAYFENRAYHGPQDINVKLRK